jgi:membrane protein implicated in regulation of membrane protease activity
MIDTLRLVLEALYAIGLMLLVGIVSGFAAAGLTSDSRQGLQVAIAMFAVTGGVLTLRLWRATRALHLPPPDRSA